MDSMKLLMKYIIISLGCAVIASCSHYIKPQPPVPFEEAISALAGNLLGQIKADRPNADPKGEISVMIIPFTDADSGEVPEVSRLIEKIIIQVGTRNFEGFHIARLTTQNTGHADYILSGNIRLDVYPKKDSSGFPMYYHVYGEVRNIANTTIVGTSCVWISDKALNYTPTAIYRDSPLYLQGNRMTIPDESRWPNYKEDALGISIKTRAMLIEARMAYENGNYEAAKTLFSMAANQKDGQDLGTYAGLYLANYKLGYFEEAEAAFAKVVSISVEKYRMLTVKYLFEVDSVELLQDENLQDRYDAWIRNIGQYFHNSKRCLRITGHASNTGSEAYNNRLSLERAKSIQKQLKKSFPEVHQRSEVVGKGFSENIVGTGTDDEHDALDRRVELFIINCS
jgi:outer membrane protein OmpA-like peptidoglycan-associated protein